jgi:S1-C subfamily serine protease
MTTRSLAAAAAVSRALALALLCLVVPAQAADRIDTIARVKRSVVAVGTFDRDRSPAFLFRGTGFAVGDGTTIATNAHVLPPHIDAEHNEVLAILVPAYGNDATRVREVRRAAVDDGSDLALLKLSGTPLLPLTLHGGAPVREGQDVLITGFPLGGIIGPFAATHRGMISAITPLAIPQDRAANLDPAVIRRLNSGSYRVFQLDATAYPGNSGSPVYDPATGNVLGIVNMVFVQSTKEAALTHPSGITYAVPASHLQALLRAR